MNLKWLLLMCFVVSSFSSFATSLKEGEELKRIVKELNYLQVQVKHIRKLQRSDDTEKLDYQALMEDLKLISEGLERHVNAPSRQPRMVKPIEGEYGSIL